MKHLILASHGDLSQAIKKSAEMIMGPQENITAISLEPQESQEDFKAKFEEAKSGLEDFVVFTDLSGGTPNNVVARYLLEGDDFPVYAGMNLPMVIAFVNAEMLEEGDVDYSEKAKENILKINDMLGK
ncbi:EIIAB-Man [Alloiococcus otitis]|uniref:PTS system, mannose/fructose/sorbose family, IIA component n=1 Tax=Alloiococcus otitis ATCC 51267 TaxID=883081 RepID=K9ED90_9LACT|nr:PTS sugar transporter subunit IIA [Alloiococcus otitis]EKU93806.1 PTS system, mannose/fructose/sorbose family, IIA component [Alloiococcus otitis ATCC 51267]SUU81755.1 EIIAB-Man [Alloiococcus otitis]